MLLCSSKLPVKDNFTPETFVELAIEWIKGSKNYKFDEITWCGEAEFLQYGLRGELLQIGLFDNERICAVHFRATDNRSVVWTTDYILDTSEKVLAFQLYREASSDAEYIHRAFSLPYLIKRVIEKGYCRCDNGLEVSDKPFLLHDEELNVAQDIIMRRRDYELPIVYMSCESDGHCVINPWRVAEKLNGVAHVIFETYRSISFALKDSTDGNNPYGGAIEIYFRINCLEQIHRRYIRLSMLFLDT